jgi:hypothetical protein
LPDFLFLVALRVVAETAQERDPNPRGVQKIPMTSLAAAVHETGASQIRDQFPKLSGHRLMVSR